MRSGSLAVIAPAVIALAAAVVSCSTDDRSASSSESVSGSPATTAVTTTTEVPASTSGSTPTTIAAPVAVRPEGFEVATLRVTTPAGDVCEKCVWLAATAEQRGRGLMGVTDLGEPVGMAFTYPLPSDGSFYMFHTVMPLSIAWFGLDSTLVDTADMEPCKEDQGSACDRYSPGASYRLAVEVPQGQLAAFGLVAGATAEVVEGSVGSRCQV